MFISSSDLALSLPYALAGSPAATSGLAFGSTSSTSSSSCSSGTTTQSASPTLYDLPTPPSAPISTPSPLASSSLALPFTSAPSPMHPLDAFETSLSSLPDWSATIDPSLLFGLEASSTKARPRAAQPPVASSSSSSMSAPGRTFFPPGSPIHAEREQDRNVPLFGESTTHEQRMEQVAALSSLIINGSAAARSSSYGPVKRTRSTKVKDGRSRSLSQGRPSSSTTSKAAAAAPRGAGRRASDDAHMVVEPSQSTTPSQPSMRSTSPGHSPTRSWLDALREAEAKAKLKRLQHAVAAGSATGTTSGAPRGRLALMHGQLLAQSMEAEAQGVPASALPPPTGGGLTVFPWGRA
ncbi:hypothetical protein JCM3775_002119 [Rhodotorula graminis]